MKSFVMTTGEIDYETVFRFRDFEDEADEDRSELEISTTLPCLTYCL